MLVFQAGFRGAQAFRECAQGIVLGDHARGEMIFEREQSGQFVIEQIADRHTGPLGHHLGDGLSIHIDKDEGRLSLCVSQGLPGAGERIIAMARCVPIRAALRVHRVDQFKFVCVALLHCIPFRTRIGERGLQGIMPLLQVQCASPLVCGERADFQFEGGNCSACPQEFSGG